MFNSYGDESEAVRGRLGSAWKKFRILGKVLIGKYD